MGRQACLVRYNEKSRFLVFEVHEKLLLLNLNVRFILSFPYFLVYNLEKFLCNNEDNKQLPPSNNERTTEEK